MSSLEDPDPEDRVEIWLTGRHPNDPRSEESEGVADGAHSLLLMEALDRRGDSDERRGVIERSDQDDIIMRSSLTNVGHHYVQRMSNVNDSHHSTRTHTRESTIPRTTSSPVSLSVFYLQSLSGHFKKRMVELVELVEP